MLNFGHVSSEVARWIRKMIASVMVPVVLANPAHEKLRIITTQALLCEFFENFQGAEIGKFTDVGRSANEGPYRVRSYF